MEVFVGLAAGVGVLVLAKRGRKAVRAAVGWTARKSGWVTSRLRSSLDEVSTVAREQYERGRAEAISPVKESAPTSERRSA